MKSLCVKAWDAKTCDMTFCKGDIQRLLIDFTPNFEQSSLFNPYQLIFFFTCVVDKSTYHKICVHVCALVCSAEKWFNLTIRMVVKCYLWWCVVQCILTVSNSGSSSRYQHW